MHAPEQGTAAVVLAGILAAQPVTGKGLAEHDIMIACDSAAGTAIAELLAEAIARQSRRWQSICTVPITVPFPLRSRAIRRQRLTTSQSHTGVSQACLWMLPGHLDRPCRGGGTIVDARQRFWLVDSKGLITRSRADADSLPDHVLPYCHKGPSHPDLKSAVAALKPSVLIGISENSQAITFCQDVCQRLATAHDRPIIMPLSLPGGALWSDLNSLEGMSMRH